MADQSNEKMQSLAKEASEIARNVEILSVDLADLECRRVSEEDLFRLANVHTQYKSDFRVLPESEEATAELRVGVSFLVAGTGQEANDELAKIRCRLVASYRLARNVPEGLDDKFSAFSRSHAMIHVWPYLRELVQSTFWRMGLPPLPIPVFRITEHLENLEEMPEEADEVSD